MTAPSFSYSGNVYTSAAVGSVDFALTSTTGNAIAYLQKAHIHVYKSTNQGATWTELTRPSQWDFTSGGTVARLVTGIASGDWIKVQRITPSTAAYVTFQSSSLLTADQLNDDTLFNTYLNQERYDQGDQSSTVAVAASAAAASATSAATAATTTANAASTAAAAATTTANAASASAATALSQSNTAITDSAAALAASANAVSTANTAATNAASAVTTAGTASTNSTAAVNTANTAASNASTALSQSATALTNSSTALSTANTAASNASTALTNSSNAVTTANTASTNASNAVTTANTANTNATAALNAVASSLQYVLVANVAAIPSSPSNNYAVEVADSTGIESFSPLANRPAGFVGDAGLSVRMQYSTTGPTWNWLNYFPNNAETRYLKLAGGTLTGQLRADDSTSVAAPVIAFDGDTNTGIAHTGADELALVTGGTARLTIDASGNVAVPGGLTKGGNSVVTTGDTGSVTSAMIADGTIVNADINASAAIAGTKISPNFGSQNISTTGTITTGAITLPNTDGTSGQVLSTNGTGTLSWATASGGSSVTTSDTPPATPNDGDLWYDSVGGRTYVYYQDPNGSQWVDASPQGGGGSSTSITTGNTTAQVIDTGSDGRFVVTTEGTEALRVDSSRRLLVGTTATRTYAGITPQIQLEGTSYNASSVSLASNSNDVNGAFLQFAKSRGTSIGSTTVVQSGDYLGAFEFYGTDGSTPRSAASIEVRVDGTPGANDMPGRLVFATTADGAASPTERVRIDSTGLVTLTGPGIKFPATQVASADANTLDDYEEGTWTPDLRAGGSALLSSGWVSNDGPRASYTRVGNCVTVLMNGRFNGFTAATGAVTIGGLPFTAADETSVGLVTKRETATTKVIGGFLSGTTISLRDQTTNASNMSPEITRADLYDYARLALCFQYRV